MRRKPAVLQIVEELAPKEMSIDKIERVLNELIKDQKKSDSTTR
jgi:flagellar biosynthesis component FlhA